MSENRRIYFIRDKTIMEGELVKQARKGGWWVKSEHFKKIKLVSMYKMFNTKQEAEDRLKEI